MNYNRFSYGIPGIRVTTTTIPIVTTNPIVTSHPIVSSVGMPMSFPAPYRMQNFPRPGFPVPGPPPDVVFQQNPQITPGSDYMRQEFEIAKSVLADGAPRSPPVVLHFDTEEELLWMGNQSVSWSSLISNLLFL